MKKYVWIFFILSFSPQTYAGVSAARRPNESFRTARDRALGMRIKSSGEKPEEAKTALSSLKLITVPEISDPAALISAFEYLRDTRFINTDINFKRRITWLYPDDGCYARAELMSQFIQSFKNKYNYVAPAKIFAFGNLFVKTENSSSGFVTWWYHVAIAYRLQAVVYILDPALETLRPLTLQEWAKRIGLDRTKIEFAICSAKAFDPNSDCDETDGVDAARALSEQAAFLSPEWSRTKELGHDPNLYLGDQPPWLRP